MSSRPPVRGTLAGSRRHPLPDGAGVLLLFSLLLLSGCKMMTENQRLAREQQVAEQERAEQVVEGENAAKISELAEEEKQLKLKVENSVARTRRQEAWQAAARLLDAGESEEALAAIEELLAANEASIESYRAAREAGITDEFLTREVEVPSEDPAAPSVVDEELIPPAMGDDELARMHVVRGTALYDLGRVQEAVADYRRAVELDPSNRPARINFGKMLFADGLYREALAAWQDELDDGYRSADLLFYIGQAHYELAHSENDANRFEAARTALREAFVAKPDDADIRRWIGLVEFETGRYESAIRFLEGIVASNPLDTYYMDLIANCHIELGNYRDAVTQLEAIVRIDGRDEKKCLGLADLYAELGVPDRAALWLERAYGGVDAMPSADRLQLGILLGEAGRIEDALAVLVGIPEDAEPFGDAQSEAARIELRLGRSEDAAKRMRAIFPRRPRDGELRLVAGDIHLELEEYDEAMDAYGQASAIPDTRASGLAGVAETFYELGNLGQAVAYYEKAVEAAPERAGFRHALDEIRAELELTRADDADGPGETP